MRKTRLSKLMFRSRLLINLKLHFFAVRCAGTLRFVVRFECRFILPFCELEACWSIRWSPNEAFNM